MRSGSRSSRQRSPRSRIGDLRSRTPRAALAVLAVLIGLASAARADASDDRRALIMLRVLAYDNHLRERAGEQVGIVIVYPAGDGGAAERARWTSAFASARKLKVDGRPVVVTAHKFESASSLGRALQELHVVGLVACDGLAKALPVGELAALTRAHKVLSFSTREREVVDGLAVGIVPGSERDEIVVNVRAATAEGVKFDAGLLQLARAVEAGR